MATTHQEEGDRRPLPSLATRTTMNEWDKTTSENKKQNKNYGAFAANTIVQGCDDPGGT